jgi:hypothetical protein
MLPLSNFYPPTSTLSLAINFQLLILYSELRLVEWNGSSGRVPTYQVSGSEFKPQYCVLQQQQQKKKLFGLAEWLKW